MWAQRLATAVADHVQDRRRRRRHRRVSSDHDVAFDEPTIDTIDRARSFAENSQVSDLSANSFPLLYSLCRRWAWGAVEFRCQTHPEEATADVVDRDGNTMLHWVLIGKPPLASVEGLLHVCPELASAVNNEGFLPLHVAAQYRASAAVLGELLRVYPEAARIPVRVKQSCALHLMADSGNRVEAFRVLLETQEGVDSLTMVDNVYKSVPLIILNTQKNMNTFHANITLLRDMRRTQKLLLEAFKKTDIYDHVGMARINSEIDPLKEEKFWLKALAMIQAEYMSRPLEGMADLESNILHACVSITCCPPSVLEMALLLYPEKLSEPDSSGQLPLHIASRKAYGRRSVLFDVLHSNPEAARVADNEGRLPLHCAIESKQTWNSCISDLLLTFSPGLETIDLDETLYPRIWSKLTRMSKSDPRCVEALFESLKAKPSIVPTTMS